MRSKIRSIQLNTNYTYRFTWCLADGFLAGGKDKEPLGSISQEKHNVKCAMKKFDVWGHQKQWLHLRLFFSSWRVGNQLCPFLPLQTVSFLGLCYALSSNQTQNTTKNMHAFIPEIGKLQRTNRRNRTQQPIRMDDAKYTARSQYFSL